MAIKIYNPGDEFIFKPYNLHCKIVKVANLYICEVLNISTFWNNGAIVNFHIENDIQKNKKFKIIKGNNNRKSISWL